MANWGRLSHLFVPVFLSNLSELLVSPAIPDITLTAICPGRDECSAAIYITGFQQAITGIGSVVMMPLFGNLSDTYGRKALLTIPLFLQIIPSAILAWKRTKYFFYAYCVTKTITSMITLTGVMCISLAYVADNVSKEKRVPAFGVLEGVVSAAYIGGTLGASLLSISQLFQVATGASVVALIYMRVFLKETSIEERNNINGLEQPMILKLETDDGDGINPKPSNKIDVAKIPSPRDIYRLLKTSATFSIAAFVAFFNSLGESGLEACLLYYLKARFHFSKTQLADTLLIAYIGATTSNMLFMPTLGPLIGEQILLSLGLFAGFLIMFLDSIAWATWVPFASASLGFFLFLTKPNLRSIVSKQVGPQDQGLAQGSVLGVTALANIISPLIYSPLSAWVLSDDAPFHFQGFSVLCVGFAWLAGFFLSIIIPILSARRKKSDDESVKA